jgi:hypothetical protein
MEMGESRLDVERLEGSADADDSGKYLGSGTGVSPELHVHLSRST